MDSARRDVNNVRRAAAGVVRVAVGAERDVSCTGWLITDSLAVVPSYVLDAGAGTPVQCGLPHWRRWPGAEIDSQLITSLKAAYDRAG